MNDKMTEILDFWFGKLDADGEASEEQSKLWWAKDKKIDQKIKKLFANDIQQAIAGKYDSWKETPKGGLALILLLDQFPRNVFRDTPEAFAHDKQALRVASHMLDKDFDMQLSFTQRHFVYMPFMHAESKSMQNCSLILFQQLADEVPEKLRKKYQGVLKFAEQHQTIVEKFGRYPHRNKILGRTSTKEETAFLQQPGSSF